MKVRILAAACVLAASGLAACATTPSRGPVVHDDPCTDPEYLALREAHPDSLSEREYQLLRDREQSCATVRALLGAAAGAKPAPSLPPNALYSWTEPVPGGGQVIRIRNDADVPITITAVELYECRNIRGSCGVKRVDVTLRPGQERILLRVHFRDGVGESHYRYRYQYEPARAP